MKVKRFFKDIWQARKSLAVILLNTIVLPVEVWVTHLCFSNGHTFVGVVHTMFVIGILLIIISEVATVIMKWGFRPGND